MRYLRLALLVCLFSGLARGQVVTANQNLANTFTQNNTFDGPVVHGGGTTFNSTVTFGLITGSTECLQVNNTGVLSGTGAPCGSVPLGSAAQLPIMNAGGTAYVAETVSGDSTITSLGIMTNTGLKSVPFCNGFTPTNGQFVQYTTALSPNPCYTASTAGAGNVSGSGLTSGQPVLGAGGSSIAVGPINLAGGASFVTGILPTGNLPAAVVLDNQANTYTAGSKQTFTASASTAGLSCAGVGADPSGLSAFDLWCRTDLKHFRYSDGSATHSLMTQDDVLLLAQTPMSSAGQILYVNNTPALAALSPGSNGTFLFLSSGLPAWDANLTDSAGTLNYNGTFGLSSVLTIASNPGFTLFTNHQTSNPAPVASKEGLAFFSDNTLYESANGGTFNQMAFVPGQVAADKVPVGNGAGTFAGPTLIDCPSGGPLNYVDTAHGGPSFGCTANNITGPVVVGGPVFGGTTTTTVVGESQPVDVGPNSAMAGTTQDAKINVVMAATYSGAGTAPTMDGRGYPAGSQIIWLHNPWDAGGSKNTNKTFELFLPGATIGTCQPTVLPTSYFKIHGQNPTQNAGNVATVIQAASSSFADNTGSASNGLTCPGNFPNGGPTLNWTNATQQCATGSVTGAAPSCNYPHGPFNWQQPQGMTGMTLTALIFDGAQGSGAAQYALTFGQNTFGSSLDNMTLDCNSLCNFAIYTPTEEEHSFYINLVARNYGGVGTLGQGTVTTINGSPTVTTNVGLFSQSLVGQPIQFASQPGTIYTVNSVGTNTLTLCSALAATHCPSTTNYTGGGSSADTFTVGGPAAAIFLDRMGNSGANSSPGGNATQAGPGNNRIDSLQGPASPGQMSGTPYDIVFEGNNAEIVITDTNAGVQGWGARVTTTINGSGVPGTPVIQYGGQNYSSNLTCALISPGSNPTLAATCSATQSGGVINSVTFTNSPTGYWSGASIVTGPTIMGGWGVSSSAPQFNDDIWAEGTATFTVFHKQAQGVGQNPITGAQGSAIHYGAGNGITLGGGFHDIQIANEGGSPATVHYGAGGDLNSFGESLCQVLGSSNPVVFDERLGSVQTVNASAANQCLAKYSASGYEVGGQTFIPNGTGAAPSIVFNTGTFGGFWGNNGVPCMGPAVTNDSFCATLNGIKLGAGLSVLWSQTGAPTGATGLGISVVAPSTAPGFSFDTTAQGNGLAYTVSADTVIPLAPISVTATSLASSPTVICTMPTIAKSLVKGWNVWAIWEQDTNLAGAVTFGIGLSATPSAAGLWSYSLIDNANPITSQTPLRVNITNTTVTAISGSTAAGVLSTPYLFQAHGTLNTGGSNNVQMVLYGITSNGSDPIVIDLGTKCWFDP